MHMWLNFMTEKKVTLKTQKHNNTGILLFDIPD